MRKLLLTLAVLLPLISCHKQDGPYAITLEGLLDEMIDREAVTRIPKKEYKSGQVSSYDRRTVSKEEPGWWANNDGGGYECLDTICGRYEKVMCDLHGAGAITRIWMTTRDKNGTMRIYLDGAAKPQIVIPAYDMKRFPIHVPDGLSLTHTHYVSSMDGVGGNTFFLPIPFAKGCKITFEEPDITAFVPRYYHIEYRMYEEDVSVKTFSIKEAKALSRKMDMVSRMLLSPDSDDSSENKDTTPETVEAAGCLDPGASIGFVLPEGPRMISNLTIKLMADSELYSDIMGSLCLKASFDKAMTIDVPLFGFVGAGHGAPKVDGWWLYNSGDGTVTCRFPMPYRRDGAISIVNTGKNPVEIQIMANTKDYYWDDSSLYFHVTAHSEKGIPVSPDYDSSENLDWNVTTINGRGVYVGDLLTLYNHAIDWYGEGDEKIYIDGEAFPSHLGTGTEDYFNCSWAPVVPFLTPFGGAPRADEESSHGYNSFLRTRILDAIPFSKSFVFDIEMLSWHPGTVDYHTISYWYGDIDTTK